MKRQGGQQILVVLIVALLVAVSVGGIVVAPLASC